MKEKQYMNYRGNIRENFDKYVNKAGLIGLFRNSDEFYGRMDGKSFWYYKPSAWGKNSFKVILQGEIVDNQVCFRYRKNVLLIPALIAVYLIFFVFLYIQIQSMMYGGGFSGDIKDSLLFVLLPIVFTVMTFVYPKKEKDELYKQLQKICGQEE